MKLYSTNNKNNTVTFREAVIKGIADDGGLYLPVALPKLPDSFFGNIHRLTFRKIAYTVSKALLEEDIPEDELHGIINRSLDFPLRMHMLDTGNYVLELFHGPTLAFKDFGARFMAETMSYFCRNNSEDITILVATSGDTGSAVANGFYNVKGIKVVLLYPSGRVSKIQEQQLTTLGGNITAVEVEGSFDDCQGMVKRAFSDPVLRNKITLSSANSINIARLLPQSFYYYYAYSLIKENGRPLIFSVPSGNLGNLTGGLIAMKMGLPVYKFIAAVNANDVFPQYLESGEFHPKPSLQTISNAMDVGNPSNFARITSLFGNNHGIISSIIFSRSYSDIQTEAAIREVFDNYGYIIDPHGAVGYLALRDYLKHEPGNYNSVILETAHPAKFKDITERAASTFVQMPERLAKCLKLKKRAIKIQNNYDQFCSLLLRG